MPPAKDDLQPREALDALNYLVELFGSVAAAARVLEMPYLTVWRWQNGRQVPSVLARRHLVKTATYEKFGDSKSKDGKARRRRAAGVR